MNCYVRDSPLISVPELERNKEFVSSNCVSNKRDYFSRKKAARKF